MKSLDKKTQQPGRIYIYPDLVIFYLSLYLSVLRRRDFSVSGAEEIFQLATQQRFFQLVAQKRVFSLLRKSDF